MTEPDAAEAYEHAGVAFELGRDVRTLREERGWTQQTPVPADRGRTGSAASVP